MSSKKPSGAMLGGHALRPAAIDGVHPSAATVPQQIANPLTWLEFLIKKFPEQSAAEWLARFAAKKIFAANGSPLPPHQLAEAGVRLYYYRTVENEAALPFEENIIFQDDFLIAVDKPHFVPVTPSGRFARESLLARLTRRTGINTLAPMHRLDRDTAGIMCFIIQPHTRGAYHTLFSERKVDKVYETIAPWRANLTSPRIVKNRIVESAVFIQMEVVDGESNSETSVEMLERCGDYARYRLCPHTGRKHQLRLHMSALGAPIVNDRIYPILKPSIDDNFNAPLKLLAKEISFTDPFTGAARKFVTTQALHFAHDIV